MRGRLCTGAKILHFLKKAAAGPRLCSLWQRWGTPPDLNWCGVEKRGRGEKSLRRSQNMTVAGGGKRMSAGKELGAWTRVWGECYTGTLRIGEAGQSNVSHG